MSTPEKRPGRRRDRFPKRAKRERRTLTKKRKESTETADVNLIVNFSVARKGLFLLHRDVQTYYYYADLAFSQDMEEDEWGEARRERSVIVV